MGKQMISLMLLVALVVFPAFTKSDLLWYVLGFATANILLVAMHPLPTLSESAIMVLCLVLLYTGAIYLLRRAVVYVSKNIVYKS
jgi:hypothetical protein